MRNYTYLRIAECIWSDALNVSQITRREKNVSKHSFSGAYGDRGILIFPVQLTTSRIGNLTRLIHTLLYV